MRPTYPYKCCRCGLCCVAETCPTGMLVHGIDKDSPCPSLSFYGVQARCELAEHDLIPIGDGCCLKARAYKDGVEYDFAALPETLKYKAVEDMRRHAKEK